MADQHPIDSPLSPAAKAVLDAFESNCTWEVVLDQSEAIAAALCAAADQVVPSVPLNLCARGTRHWHRAIRDGEIRLTITAIAAELDGGNNTSQED